MVLLFESSNNSVAETTMGLSNPEYFMLTIYHALATLLSVVGNFLSLYIIYFASFPTSNNIKKENRNLEKTNHIVERENLFPDSPLVVIHNQILGGF